MIEWYWIVLIVIWAVPVGFFTFAILFVGDGNKISALLSSLLWPLWLPIYLIAEIIEYLKWRAYENNRRND
jgi:hypothetical protein